MVTRPSENVSNPQDFRAINNASTVFITYIYMYCTNICTNAHSSSYREGSRTHKGWKTRNRGPNGIPQRGFFLCLLLAWVCLVSATESRDNDEIHSRV